MRCVAIAVAHIMVVVDLGYVSLGRYDNTTERANGGI
jgi:hypothetical protein